MRTFAKCILIIALCGAALGQPTAGDDFFIVDRPQYLDTLKRLKDFTSTVTLFDRQYTYNSAKQISSITELTGTRNLTYDLVNRLTGVSGAQTESYTFDDVGNRTSSHLSSTYGYQSGHFNRLISTTTANYGFDANGNTATKSEGSNFWRYGWDHENRLVSAGTRKQTVRYRYDALGRRVERNLGFGRERTKFTYDGDDVLLDDNSGTLTKYLNSDGIDNKLRATTGSNATYFLADHLGSTNGLADGTGVLAASTAYDSFGNATNTNFSSRYQFTGREYDSFTGLHYYRGRFYAPNLGRFISEDPIGFAGGDINLYGYVWNNPVRFSDPFGLYGYDIVEQLNEVRWRLEQRAIETAETPIYVVTGFGDTAGLGIPRLNRQWQGIENVNWSCSTAYDIGGWAAIAATAATGGVGLYRGGLSLLTRSAGTRVFWSGSPTAKDVAANFARTVKGSTLEMTAGGRALAAIENGLPKTLTKPLWTDLSAAFARGARGGVHPFKALTAFELRAPGLERNILF